MMDKATRSFIIQLEDEVARLREANAELVKACKAVVQWLGEPEFETSDGAHPAFRKALLSCRTAIAKATA